MTKKFALLIGNDNYRDRRLGRLFAPQADVDGFAEVLQDSNIGEFGESDIRKFFNSDLVSIQEGLSWLFDNRDADDIVLFYYSGHGLVDSNGNLYFALDQTKVDQPRIGSLEATYVKRLMDESHSRRQVVILDCCHSGAFVGDGRISRDAASPILTERTFDPKGQGRYILAASAAGASSFEDDKGRSYFTRALVKGLRNGEIAPTKEEVTIADLRDFARREMKIGGVPMEPRLWVDEETGPLVIAKNPLKPLDPAIETNLKNINPVARIGALFLIEKQITTLSLPQLSKSIMLLQERIDDQNESGQIQHRAQAVLTTCLAAKEHIENLNWQYYQKQQPRTQNSYLRQIHNILYTLAIILSRHKFLVITTAFAVTSFIFLAITQRLGNYINDIYAIYDVSYNEDKLFSLRSGVNTAIARAEIDRRLGIIAGERYDYDAVKNSIATLAPFVERYKQSCRACTLINEAATQLDMLQNPSQPALKAEAEALETAKNDPIKLRALQSTAKSPEVLLEIFRRLTNISN